MPFVILYKYFGNNVALIPLDLDDGLRPQN